MAPQPNASKLSEADRERLFAAFVGPNWQRHYRGSFAALRASRSWWRGHWNWAAALVPFWLAWRRLGVYQLAAFFAFGYLSVLPLYLFGDSSVSSALGWAMAVMVVLGAEGYWGDRWLLASAEQVIGSMVILGAVDSSVLTRVAKKGGISVVRPALVLAVFGLFLWGLMTPFLGTKEKAYVAAMKSDLRNLVYREAQYHAERGVYTTDPADSVRSETDSSTREQWFRTSPGVSVTVNLLETAGWFATARHSATRTICEIWVGSAPPHLSGIPEEQPKCRKP